MFCPNCGAQISETDKFCPACGNAIAEAAPQPEAQPQQTYAQPEAQPQQTYAQPEPQPEPQASYTQPEYAYAPPNYSQPKQSYAQPVFYDCGVQARDIVVAVILSIVTCGIYSIFWTIKLVDDVNRVANDQSAYSGGITWLLMFVTGGIYGWYWYYQAAKKMQYAKQVRNMRTEDNTEILYLVLAIFGFAIVDMCLIQSDLNKMATPAA